MPLDAHAGDRLLAIDAALNTRRARRHAEVDDFFSTRFHAGDIFTPQRRTSSLSIMMSMATLSYCQRAAQRARGESSGCWTSHYSMANFTAQAEITHYRLMGMATDVTARRPIGRRHRH
jgi:hypothetical protein